MSAGPIVSSEGSVTGAQAGKRSAKQKRMFGVVAAVAALVVFVGLVYGALQYLNGSALKTYSNTDYSLLAPGRGYAKEVTGAQTFFVKRDKNNLATSGVVVVYQKFLVAKTDAEVDKGIAQYKQQAKNIVNGLVGGDYGVENVQTKDTTSAGGKALRVTASFTKDSKVAGKVTANLIMTSTRAVSVGVIASASGELANKTDQILTSFELAKVD